MEAKPASPIAEIDASAPPARNISASPNLIIRQASPILLLAVAHAVTIDILGPQSPYSIEMRPLAILLIIIGIVKGDTRLGPLLRYISCCFSKVINPPMPLPTMQPNRKGSNLHSSIPLSS